MKVARILAAFGTWLARAWLVASVACVPFAGMHAARVAHAAALDRPASTYEAPRARSPHVERTTGRAERASRRSSAHAAFALVSTGIAIAAAESKRTPAPVAARASSPRSDVTPARARGPPIEV